MGSDSIEAMGKELLTQVTETTPGLYRHAGLKRYGIGFILQIVEIVSDPKSFQSPEPAQSKRLLKSRKETGRE